MKKNCKHSPLLTGSIQTRLTKSRVLSPGALPLKLGRHLQIQTVVLCPISSVYLALIKLLLLPIWKVYNLKPSTHVLDQSVFISYTILNI